MTIELDKPYEYYSVVGNSSEVTLDVSQVGNVVTIIPDKYSLNDSYEVVFFDKEKETITVYQSSGSSGGGSSTKWKTKYVDNNLTEYVDKEVEVIKEVPRETIETEKIVKISKWWLVLWIIFGFIIGGILVILSLTSVYCTIGYGLIFDRNSNTDTRRYENNE